MPNPSLNIDLEFKRLNSGIKKSLCVFLIEKATGLIKYQRNSYFDMPLLPTPLEIYDPLLLVKRSPLRRRVNKDGTVSLNTVLKPQQTNLP